MTSSTESLPVGGLLGSQPGTRVGEVLVHVAGLLEELTAEQWESPSLCEGWRVRDVAGHIIWRIGNSAGGMLRDARTALFVEHISPRHIMDELSLRAGEGDYEEIVRRIRSIAAARLAGVGRTGIGDLIESVVHGFDIAQPLGIDLAIDQAITDSVAARSTLLAGSKVRSVLRERTLVASDAGWRIGHGPELEGTAEAIVLFLFGRRALPSTDHAG